MGPVQFITHATGTMREVKWSWWSDIEGTGCPLNQHQTASPCLSSMMVVINWSVKLYSPHQTSHSSADPSLRKATWQFTVDHNQLMYSVIVWTDNNHYLNNKNIMSSEYMFMYMIFCLPSLIPVFRAWVKFKVFHACLCQKKNLSLTHLPEKKVNFSVEDCFISVEAVNL